MTSDIPWQGRVAAFMYQLALVASITVLAVFVYRVVQHALSRHAASGIPVERPEAKRRVFHPAGFSIVSPEYWTPELIAGAGAGARDEIILWSPADAQPNARLSVLKLDDEGNDADPELVLGGKSREVRFQGRPARMAVTHRDEVSLEFPAQLTVELAFVRDDAVWRLRYDLFLNRRSIPTRMWDYLETFSTTEAPPSSTPPLRPQTPNAAGEKEKGRNPGDATAETTPSA